MTSYIVLAIPVFFLLIGIEVLAARVMAPALGSGVVTWSTLLAVALGMLTAHR